MSGSSAESSRTTFASRSSESTASGWPCGDHTTVASSLIRIGSTITSRCARCSGPISIATRSWHSPSAPAGWPSTPVKRCARVECRALLLDHADDRARGVVAADLRKPLVDLLAAVAIDHRDEVEHAGTAGGSPAWRSWSSPRSPSSISAGEVCSALQTRSIRSASRPLTRPAARPPRPARPSRRDSSATAPASRTMPSGSGRRSPRASTSSSRVNRLRVSAHGVEDQALVGLGRLGQEAGAVAELHVHRAGSACAGPGSSRPSDSDTPSSGCTVSTSWLGCTPTEPACWKARCGTGFRMHGDLRHPAREPLAGAQVERHAGPAPVGDLEPQRRDRSRCVEVSGTPSSSR